MNEWRQGLFHNEFYALGHYSILATMSDYTIGLNNNITLCTLSP